MLKRFADWTAEFAKEAHLLYTCASIVSNTIPVGGGLNILSFTIPQKPIVTLKATANPIPVIKAPAVLFLR